MTERPRQGRTIGAVTRFDEHVGLGSVVDSAGTEFPFHCVEIEGGSRSIDVGTSVHFAVRYKLGREEACSIRPAI